jgi:cyanophycin synthetase
MSLSEPLYFARSLPEGVVREEEIDPFLSTQMIIDEAQKIGVSAFVIPDTDVVQLQYKTKILTFRERIPSTTNFTGVESCYDKQLCKVMLKRSGLSVMPGYTIYQSDSDDRIKSIWDSLQKPLVLKPAKGSHGKGVEMELFDFNECLEKIRLYFKNPLYPGLLILEEMFVGHEYRIIATQEKVLAVMERIPARIIGDGVHTVNELIEIENANPLRNISQHLYPHIVLDDNSVALLKDQDLTAKSVPKKNQLVRLQKVSNIMAGGIAVDRTDDAHPSVKQVAVEAVRAIPGLSWTGIDFMCKDISQPQSAETYTIIEMNSAPEFAMHDLPMQGKSREVTKEFVYLMFPELRS